MHQSTPFSAQPSFIVAAGALAFAWLSALGCGPLATDSSSEPLTPSCMTDEGPIDVGQSIRNDCNSCICEADGSLSCSRQDCTSTCTVGEMTYGEGESFATADGCNTCTCEADGSLACTQRACPPSGCTANGTRYELGESVPANDDCNTCTCTETGVMCTVEDCSPPQPPINCPDSGCSPPTLPPTCTVAEAVYEVGDEFPAEDDCNTCTCTETGVVCSVEDCGSCSVGEQSFELGESFPAEDGCNTCTCTEDGVACTEIACPRECGGIQGLVCEAGEFCNFAIEASCGAADQLGACEVLPGACVNLFDPVCGCDGETYGNACQAAARGVSVAARGACDAECSERNPCPSPPCACLDENGDGVCENDCPSFVCSDGQCVLPPEPAPQPGPLALGDECGAGETLPGTPLRDCGPGLFCQHQPGALCGAADAPGECVVAPDSCIEIFTPVCGCDGETYSSTCHAALARMGILSEGACEPPEQP